MGEIADMIMDGVLDEETGEYIGDHNIEFYGEECPGFPVNRRRDVETLTGKQRKKRKAKLKRRRARSGDDR